MTIEDMKSVVKHVFLADHDLRKTYVVALGDVVCCFIIGKDVRGWKPLSSHSPTFEPLRRGRKKWWRLEEGDVIAGNIFCRRELSDDVGLSVCCLCCCAVAS